MSFPSKHLRSVRAVAMSLVSLACLAMPNAVGWAEAADRSPAGAAEPASSNEGNALAAGRPPDQTLIITPAKRRPGQRQLRFWPAAETRLASDSASLFARAVLMTPEDGVEERFAIGRLHKRAVAEMGGSPVKTDDVKGQRLIEMIDAAIERNSSALDELRRARTMTTTPADMALEGLDATQFVELLLPEVQASRQLARLLVLRGYRQIQTQQWASLSDTVTDLFRLSEMVDGANEFLVTKLVQLAIVSMAHDLIATAWENSDCPSFHYALMTVPASLFATRSSLEFEVGNLRRWFPELAEVPDDVDEADSRRRLRDAIQRVAQLSRDVGIGPNKNSMQATTMAFAFAMATESSSARQRLRERFRWDGDRVDELGDAEAVLRDASARFNEAIDSALGIIYRPAESRAVAAEAWEQKYLVENDSSELDPTRMVHQVLMPSIGAATEAGFRTRLRHELWIALEAIRLHTDEAFPTEWGQLEAYVPPSAASTRLERLDPTRIRILRSDVPSSGTLQLLQLELSR